MKYVLAGALAALFSAGNAAAAEGLRIESEAQFVRDYGDRIEQIGPGVYLIVGGELAGKTVSLGEAGLSYDIDVKRGQLMGSSRGKAQTRATIRQMENVRARFKQLRAYQAIDAGARKAASGSFPCVYWSGGRATWYNGFAQVNATTEFYLNNSGGGFNWYYARASASASGYVIKPFNVPTSFSLSANVIAKNLFTGQVVQTNVPGLSSAGASTGYVYSGPEFSHNLYALASVNGIGNCFGYVSISDTMQ